MIGRKRFLTTAFSIDSGNRVPRPIQLLESTADQVLIALNPKAGARSRRAVVEQLQTCLADRGYAAETMTDIQRLRDRAEALFQEGRLRAVVAAGGDGTVALVANQTPPGTPIAALPMGTENLLSKYLGITADPRLLCDLIAEGAIVHIDAAQAGDRIFLLMLGCGFDAEVVRRLDDQRTGHISHLSYAKPIIDSIRNYDYPELTVRCDPPRSAEHSAAERTLTAKWVFVVNLPRYAGGLRIAPQAVGTDSLLDVCTFKEGSLLNGLRYLTGIVFGQHESWDDFQSLRAKKIRIESAQPVPYQLDGDPGGFLPVDIEVLPERLTLVVSPDWAVKNGFEPVGIKPQQQ